MGSADRPRDRLGRPLRAGEPDELPRRTGPPPSTAAAIDEAVGLFDAERFFEAHERFELVWQATDTAVADRRFWKGVTQVAVGCCHVQRGNPRGASALLRRAARHLEPRTVQRVDGAALIRLALELAAEIERGGARALGAFPRFPPRGAGGCRKMPDP